MMGGQYRQKQAFAEEKNLVPKRFYDKFAVELLHLWSELLKGWTFQVVQYWMKKQCAPMFPSSPHHAPPSRITITMQRQYDDILELVRLWQKFSEQSSEAQSNTEHAETTTNTRLQGFQVWLGAQMLKRTEHAAASATEQNTQQKTRHDRRNMMKLNETVQALEQQAGGRFHYALASNTETKISVLIGRMGRFAKFYAKKALNQQPVSTIDEFTFLASIRRAGMPTKTEVCVDNITELTTGTEILRRMIQAGFVEEFQDTFDRRVKRLRLTAAGTDVLLASFERLREVAQIVVGKLSEEKQRQLLEILNDLDDFHYNVYANQRSESVEQIIAQNVAFTATSFLVASFL
jgi:DNA-binding MarR family transcriptional regulator